MKIWLAALFAASAMVLAFVPLTANAEDIPVPERGSTGSACYEDCMWHYRDFNNMVDESVARQCQHGCGLDRTYSAPIEDHACTDACAAQYNECMANSPDPQNDRACPMNQLQCMQPCYH